MTTQATVAFIAGQTLGGQSSCKADWVQEQICRAPLSASGTSISMTQYVGAAFDEAVNRCASYVNSAAPNNNLGLTSYENLCSSKKYPVSASSWKMPANTTSTSGSTGVSMPVATNAAVSMGWNKVEGAVLLVVGGLMAII
jgi:hypothetical protein